MADLMLSARDICLDIDGRQILKQIQFDVQGGEFIGIIGSNGAGKSSLLKSLLGILKTTGEIRLFGRNLREMSEKEIARNVAYMQQEINMGFGLTARQVVMAGRYPYLSWWQHESKADRAIAEKYMKFTGVSHLADKDISQMSGGERQRVLLAKVLTQETNLIFLDEPTASLDLTYQEEIFRRCKEICAMGKSIVVVVHDIRLAAKFCSRLILVNKGQILANGSPASVITKKNLKEAYQLEAVVFENYVSGQLDLYTHIDDPVQYIEHHVHIIGGGGTAAAILRALHDRHCSLSAGALSSGDTDFLAATAFSAEIADRKPFGNVEQSMNRANMSFVAKAYVTILCSTCFSEQNIDDLKDAFLAERLVILEDMPIQKRDFTGGEATHLYEKLLLKASTVCMSTRKFLALLEEKKQSGFFEELFAAGQSR